MKWNDVLAIQDLNTIIISNFYSLMLYFIFFYVFYVFSGVVTYLESINYSHNYNTNRV